MSQDSIVSDPRVMLGKPAIRGTRITIELMFEKLGAGEAIEQILAAHPGLAREALQSACAYAGSVLRNDITYPADEVAG
jgi:uncharacterized protein (DUF433 family)